MALDFYIDIKHAGDAVILQLTDMQIIDASQKRTTDRLCELEDRLWQPENREKLAYSQIRELVETVKPDLIIITGDIVYGEFDDSGRGWLDFLALMDSFGIPWAPVFGNHDNETKMGIDWQCEMLERAESCLFSRGNVFGSSNYTVGIRRNGVLERVLYMTDSNGCGRLGVSEGIRENQLSWMESIAEKVGKVPSFVCFHIPTDDYHDAYVAAGYQERYDNGKVDCSLYHIGKDCDAKNGDFGRKHEWLKIQNQRIMPTLKHCNADGVFCGHCHKINTSVMYDGIRFTMGLKTGLYDYHEDEAVGGTEIRLPEGGGFGEFKVRHINLEVECERCGMRSDEGNS